MDSQLDWKKYFTNGYKERGYNDDEITNIYKIEMELRRYFEFDGLVPTCLRLQNIQRDKKKIMYFWESESDRAICPQCKTMSVSVRVGDYYERCIQDVPQSEKTVFHVLRSRKFHCLMEECPTGKFIERFYEFVDERARKTLRFKKYCVVHALGSGCLGAEREIRGEGGIVSNDSIGRYVKEKSAGIIEETLTINDVKVLAIDDINLRKGDSSSSCTVFVDQETHKILIIIRGTTKEAVEKVMMMFPSSEIMSRDRATAYASAGSGLGKIQVADRFHLITNAQTAVKNALMSNVPANIFIRDGDGWVQVGGEPGELSDAPRCHVPEQTVEERIKLAGLSPKKALKYTETIKMIKLDGMGLKTADIAKEMGVPYSRVQALRRKAVSIITEVENRINTRITKCREADSVAPTYQSPGESAVKTVGGKRVQLSGQSIVEPYREIVIKLWKEGGNHRTIYPVLQTEGYTGSKNAIYQYILKLGKELPDVMNRECKIKTPGGETDDGFDVAAAESRSGLKIERVARNNVYRGILKEASEQRKKENEAASGESPAEPENKQLDNVSENKGGVRPAMSKHSPLDENTLSIMYGQDSPSVGGESETKEKKTF